MPAEGSPWIAIVGKEAYRGAFGERAALGALEGRLADTRLFVLPSTSPANAAVPYAERLRWFEELAARSSVAERGRNRDSPLPVSIMRRSR